MKYGLAGLLLCLMALEGRAQEDWSKLKSGQGQFFLNESQRLFMEAQRKQFVQGKSMPSPPKEIKQPEAFKRPKPKPQPVKNKVPDRVAVTAIYILPSGEKKVRVNGRYTTQGLKYAKLLQQQTTADQACFSIQGKAVCIPVGKMYLTKQKKLIVYQAPKSVSKKIVKASKPVVAEKQKETPAQGQASALDELKQMQQQIDHLKKQVIKKPAETPSKSD